MTDLRTAAKALAKAVETPKLATRDRQLRQIIAGISDGVILVGTDQRILWANPCALQMHGVEDVADLGATVSDFRERFELRYRNRHVLPEGSYPLERLIAGEAFDEVVVEVASAGADKAQWTHRIRSLVLNDDKGVPDCLVLILNDETERYSAEQRFESAFAANPAPAIILRLQDLCHIRVNRGFLDMTGYGEDDVIGRSLYEIDVLEDAARREFAFGRLKEGRAVPQMEATLQLPGGGEKSVIVAGQPIDVGDQNCMLFTFADLDGRRQAEAALRQSEERFEIAFRLSPVPTLVLLSNDCSIILANDAFKQETGYTHDDIVGQKAADLPLWSDKQAGATLELLLKKNGRVRGLASSLETKDGHSLECLVSAEAVEIQNQSCVLLVAQNIAEHNRSHLEVASAIEAVMSDTAWFTSVVLERLNRMGRHGETTIDNGELADLTPRIREVLDLVCQGVDDDAIAAKLKVSRNTIRNHLTNLYRRTGAKSRAKLVVWARERGVTGRSDRNHDG
jgi:PAS domain S-box-containing protein